MSTVGLICIFYFYSWYHVCKLVLREPNWVVKAVVDQIE
jgi:hypothetical protein